MITHHALKKPSHAWWLTRCGYDDDAMITDAFEMVNCVVCRDLWIPVTPGPEELPLRHSRPDYVSHRARYRPIEFVDERPRGTARVWYAIVAVLLISLIVGAVVAILAVPQPRTPDVTPDSSTPSIVQSPPAGDDIIWTRRR